MTEPVGVLTDAEADAFQRLQTSSFWDNGCTLNVYLRDGDDHQRSFVKKYARQWQPHLNLAFNFNCTEENSHIRIWIAPRDGGRWSMMGSQALAIVPPLHTMELNLQTDFLIPDDQNTVLHEFGRVTSNSFLLLNDANVHLATL